MVDLDAQVRNEKNMWQVDCETPEDTARLGEALGRACQGPAVVALAGPLGAGKTCFAQGVGDALGVVEPVVSPTFVLVAEYDGRLPLLHADVYRLEGHELLETGLEETLESWPGLALVEWADRFPDLLPPDHLSAVLALTDAGRRLTLTARGPRAAALLERWRQEATDG